MSGPSSRNDCGYQIRVQSMGKYKAVDTHPDWGMEAGSTERLPERVTDQGRKNLVEALVESKGKERN